MSLCCECCRCREAKPSLRNDSVPSRPLGFPHLFSRWMASRNVIPSIHASTFIDAPNASFNDAVATSVDQLESARPTIVVSEDEVKTFIGNETGKDRLRAMFSKDKNGETSADLTAVLQIAQTCGFFFFIFTSVAGARQARETFLQKNKATVYDTKLKAARAYNDAVLFGSMRSGLKWGLKSALFAGIFTLASQTIAVYRNRTSVIEYAIGGGLTCALLRMNMGLRGVFAGGVIGSGLGLVGGAAMCAVLYLSDETQQRRHYSYVCEQLRENREAELLSGNVIKQTSHSSSETVDNIDTN